MPDDAPKPITTTGSRTKQRRKYLAIFAAILVVVAVSALAWDWLIGSNYVSTDDAYVGGDMAQITPQLNAAVVRVLVEDTQMVKAGDILVELDGSDAQIAVAKAEADLATIAGKVGQIFATSRALGAEIINRQAAIRHAEATQLQARSQVEKTQIDLKRREELQASGAV